MRPAFRRLLPFLLKYRRQFVIGLICVVITTTIQLLSPWVLKFAIDDLTAGVTRAQARLLLGRAPRHRLRRRGLPLSDAADPHRRLARHRVRRPQRVLRAAAADAAGLLPGAADRRSDVARDQRSQRRAHDDRPRGDVFRQHHPGVRRGDPADALARYPADADGAAAAAARLDQRPVLRRGHPQALRGDPGAARQPQRHRPGGAGGRARGARLQPGGARDRAVPRRQPASSSAATAC